jgi:hypothetical protein
MILKATLFIAIAGQQCQRATLPRLPAIEGHGTACAYGTVNAREVKSL